jgi:hypothetical protein
MRIWIRTLIVLLSVSTDLFAGVILTYTWDRYFITDDKDQPIAQHCESKRSFDTNKIAIETSCHPGPSVTGRNEDYKTIYRSDKNLIWNIDLTKNTYTELTKAESIKLHTLIPADPNMKSRYQRTGKALKVNQWDCRVYSDGLGSEEICVTDGDQVLTGISAKVKLMQNVTADFHVMDDEMLKTIVPRALTIEDKKRVNGKLIAIEELAAAKEEPIPPAIFELPVGVMPAQRSTDPSEQPRYLWGSYGTAP